MGGGEDGLTDAGAGVGNDGSSVNSNSKGRVCRQCNNFHRSGRMGCLSDLIIGTPTWPTLPRYQCLLRVRGQHEAVEHDRILRFPGERGGWILGAGRYEKSLSQPGDLGRPDPCCAYDFPVASGDRCASTPVWLEKDHLRTRSKPLAQLALK